MNKIIIKKIYWLLVLVILTVLSVQAQSSSGKIAFDNNDDIYTINADGTLRTRLTFLNTNAYEPSWSPDGSKIVFACDDGICIVNADGTGLRVIPNTLNDDNSPSWSPDGNRIAFARNYTLNNEGIFIINVNGSNLIQLTTTKYDENPNWFPDGTRLLFSRDTSGGSFPFTRALFTINVNGGSPSLLLGGGDYFDPNLSSDGSKIAFAGSRNNTIEIYTVNANGSALTQITNNGSNGVSRHPAWSPDNNKIAYSFYTNGVNEDDIYVMSANGTNRINITNTPNIEENEPVWQPSTNVALNITIQTNPTGRTFTVDGVTYNSTQTFNWQSGAAHTIGTTSPQTGNSGTQYVWSNWSDGGAISHTVSPTGNVTYTANFTDSLPQCIRPNLGWDFGDVLFGTSQEKTFTYTNNSPISFTPQNYTLEGAADYCITSNTCENTLLAPGQSCTWTAKFTARAGGLRRNEEFNLFTKPGLSNGSDCTSLIGKGTLNANFVDARYQNSSSWGSLPYAHCPVSPPPPARSYTIGARGCALTSLTMAINYVKKAAPITSPIELETPDSLQTFALSPGINGFDRGLPADACIRGRKGNEVNFHNIVANYSIPFNQTRKPFQWNIFQTRSINNANAASALSAALNNGYPIIVAILHKKAETRCNVTNPADNCYYKGHFVLVTKDLGGGNFQVTDPGSSATDLESVKNNRNAAGWETSGYVSVKNNAYELPKQARNCPASAVNGLCDENTVESSVSTDTLIEDGSFTVVANEKVDFLIVNSEGQRTGYDNATQKIIQEIPNSSYSLENIFTLDDPVPTDAVSSASVSHPKNGVYQLLIKGAQSGQYNITVNRTNRYGQPLSPLEFSGTIQTGETRTLTFNYSFSKNSVDFDNDGNTDISVFRPSNGIWYLLNSTSGFTGVQFGASADKIVPADYDGDGKTDAAVYRGGIWYLNRSQSGFLGVSFGSAEDIPVPADYDGDGKGDIAVFRPSNGTWYLQRSSLGFAAVQFGQTGDRPAPADYDGDGKADFAVYRGGVWFIQRSQTGFTAVQFGTADDKIVPADYDGDGKTDIAVYRPSNGVWYVQQSTAGFTAVQFGAGTDLPVAADYDGDGKADAAVFRPSNGVWYLNRSTQGFTGVSFGLSGDKPIANAFVQ